MNANMKGINEAINSTAHRIKMQQRVSCTSPGKQPSEKRELWHSTRSELAAAFAIHCVDFSKRFGEEIEAVMAEYARTLWTEGLGTDDLERGINRLRARAAHERFTPTPVEFRDMCLPGHEELGLPSIEEVEQELLGAIDFYRRHPVKKYWYQHRMSELVAERCLRAFAAGDPTTRMRVLKTEYNNWLSYARKNPLPEKRVAIAQIAEPRPAYEAYLRDNQDVPRDPELVARIKRIRLNQKLRVSS